MLKLKDTFLTLIYPADDCIAPPKMCRAFTCPSTCNHGPSETDLVQTCYESERLNPSGNTTVMLRNIPNKYCQKALLENINSRGFADSYDFFYMPIDFKNGCSMGYAFINFLDHQCASKFFDAYSGYMLPGKSSKVCAVNWARVQGLMANVEHYRNNPVNLMTKKSYKPMLFLNGTEVPFPKPDQDPLHSPGSRIANFTPGNSLGAHDIQRGRWSNCGGNSDTTIFVGGMDLSTTEVELMHHFGAFGPVSECRIVRNKATGVSRGFGIVCFRSPSSLGPVYEVREHIIRGKNLGIRPFNAKSTR